MKKRLPRRRLKHDGRGDEACSRHCPACHHERSEIERARQIEAETRGEDQP